MAVPDLDRSELDHLVGEREQLVGTVRPCDPRTAQQAYSPCALLNSARASSSKARI
jgi:hypothetical protein